MKLFVNSKRIILLIFLSYLVALPAYAGIHISSIEWLEIVFIFLVIYFLPVASIIILIFIFLFFRGKIKSISTKKFFYFLSVIVSLIYSLCISLLLVEGARYYVSDIVYTLLFIVFLIIIEVMCVTPLNIFLGRSIMSQQRESNDQ